MATLDDVLSGVKRVTSRLETVEKTVDRMGQLNEAARVIQKSLTHGGGRAYAAVGHDGATEMNLVQLSSPVTKALGWGTFLQHVAAAGEGRNIELVEKKLAGMHSRPVQKTPLAEGAGATGGYTVPVQFYADLLRLIAEDAFVRGLCTTIPMQSATLQVPALNQSATPTTGTSAFFGGIAASWQPEAATINESEPTFRQVQLTARNLVFYTIASNQLLEDNAVALDSLLTTLFKEAMAWFYDYFILRGNGAGQPLGALNGANVLTVQRSGASTFSLANLGSMVGKLLLQSAKSACWVMHPSCLPILISLTNGATNSPFLVWLNPAPNAEGGPAAQNLPMKLFGFPIYWSEKVPALGTDGDVNLIDFSKQLVGDRLAIQIEASNQVRFLNNQMVWRIIARWDSQPWLNAPVTMADGVYQMSNAVKLIT